MAALCPLKSLRCCPQGPTKHPHEVPNPPGNAHGCVMDPTLDTHDGQTPKQGQDTSWKRARSSSSAFGVSAMGEVATWPWGSTAHHSLSLTAAGCVAGALSQAHKDIARPRRIFRIGTVALGTIRLQR